MMQKHKVEYELVFPLVSMATKAVKKLTSEDVLLLGFDSLELYAVKDDMVCAKLRLLSLENQHFLEVYSIEKERFSQENTPKYKNIKLSLSKIEKMSMQLGHRIDMSELNLKEVTLIEGTKALAKCSLVKVDEELALSIDRMMK